MINKPIVEVEELSVAFVQSGKLLPVVEQVSFSLEAGEILGIVGESGSGKTMSALAIMGLLPNKAQILGGNITFLGEDVLSMTKDQLQQIKGSGMAMVFQEPMSSFNPLLTIGEQVEEMRRLHKKDSKAAHRKRTLEAFREVELVDVERLYKMYPHQLSGGMRQRAMIAMAMIAEPKLIIADEPTTALDATIQYKILKLLKKINQKYGTSILFVSHDLGVIKSICHKALVMKNGRIVEQGNAKELFQNPKDTYTKALVAAAPVVWMQKSFVESPPEQSAELAMEDPRESLLHVEGLNVFYGEKEKGYFSKRVRKQVLKKVSFRIRKGEILGIVGESGSGKSTLAKAIAGLIKDQEGIIQQENSLNNNLRVEALKPQMVFQDPYSSLNPAKKISWILEEPLKIQGGIPKNERRARVLEIIQQVGLQEKHLDRYVSQLSGGQRQRVAIAAAFILHPKLIILDEPVSALDVTVQAQILSLLKDLQQKYHVTYLFISHDLNVVYQFCHRVGVMYQGEIVEFGDTQDIFMKPQHDYTKVLLEASIPE